MLPVLASTIHDPHSALNSATREYLPVLASIYPQICISATTATNRELIALLERYDVRYVQADRGIGDGRRDCVRLAYENGAEIIHYCDFDRILHWLRTYPEELLMCLTRLAEYDFTVLGRTPRAFATHPPFQIEPERLTNRAFSVWIGQEMDVTTGSRGLNRAAAEAILRNSSASGPATDCEWSAICKRASLTVGHFETEGLEWETPDYMQDQIEAAGSFMAWLLAYNADIRRWHHRTQLALDSIAVLL